jgi:hypothetical protein
VPLRVGENLIGFLKTGEVMLNWPSERRFARAARQLADWGLKPDLRRLREPYFQTRTVSKNEYTSVVRLLEIFAQHLSLVANQLLIQQGNSESRAITRARQFIAEHYAEEIAAGKGRSGSQHEQLLFLQDVQEGDWSELYQLSFARPRRKGKESSSEPKRPGERSRFR